MWAFFGVVFAVFLQRSSYGAPVAFLHLACKDLHYPTWHKNIDWDHLTVTCNDSLQQAKIYHKEMEYTYEEFNHDIYFDSTNKYTIWDSPILMRAIKKYCNNKKDCVFEKVEKTLKTFLDYIPNLPTDDSGKKIAFYFFRSAWILDYPFPDMKCPYDYILNEYRVPVPQLQYVSKLSSLFLDTVSYKRTEICELTQSLGRTATKPMRDRVSEVCEKNEHDNLCQLNPFFELTDIFEDTICNTATLDEASWNKDSKIFNLYRSSLTLLFYSFQREVPSKYKSLIDFSGISEQNVKDSIHNIITELYEKVKNGEEMIHSVLDTILTIVPSKSRLVGDGIADYPSFNWIVSTGVNALQQVRSFVVRYGVGKARNITKQKSLDTQIDYRHYIQTLKTTQIKEMTDSIPSNIQALSDGIGTYFYQVATYEKRKKTADVSYLQSTINKYKQAFHEATSKLTQTMVPIITIYAVGAEAELAEDTAKLVAQVAAAGNPLKWILGGDPGDIIDSTGAVAESLRKLKDALGNIAAYGSLIEFNGKISKKLSKNEGPLKAVRTLLNDIENNSNSTVFGRLQDQFISQYSDYTPAVRKDELKELTVRWENLIDAICTGVENTGGMVANAARGIGDTNGKCLKAKRSAAMLTVCIEEIYDFQFELMETMASLMHSFVQIESSKALGSSSQDKLSTNDFQMIAAIIGISYKMTQANNVEMLCNILEYQNGGKVPSVCKGGLSTDIDTLTSTERPNYIIEEKYVEVPTQRNIPLNDALAWFDLAKLYAGETILFQIPNSAWLVKQEWIPDHLKDRALYVKYFSVILPVVSQSRRQIEVVVIPSYVGNKLHDNSDTYYSIAHAQTMAYSYIEGHRQHKCAIQPNLENPYKIATCSKDSEYPTLCRTSRGTSTQINEVLYPSIYSEFLINIYGYEDAKLDVPATKTAIQIDLTYFFLSENQRQKRTTIRKKRSTQNMQVDSSCCPQNNYFNSDTNQCQACPTGTRSFYDGLFCGNVIKMVEADYTNETFTYDIAAARCKEVGSINIANSTEIQEAVNLGAKSCTCGWIGGRKVMSVGDRSDCKDKAACTIINNVRHVYCATRFKP